MGCLRRSYIAASRVGVGVLRDIETEEPERRETVKGGFSRAVNSR